LLAPTAATELGSGVNPHPKSEAHQRFLAAHYERRLFENVGHNPVQENPIAFAQAIVDRGKRQ
jgi:pimeloyl-ACP methyl ester carboxylesterase